MDDGARIVTLRKIGEPLEIGEENGEVSAFTGLIHGIGVLKEIINNIGSDIAFKSGLDEVPFLKANHHLIE